MIQRSMAFYCFVRFRAQLNESQIVESIAPEKDVDGISSAALGKLFSGDKHAFAPCTAQAVMEILHFYGIEPQGKRAVVLGRSLVVGKPLSMLLLNENATVTICHSRTASLPEVCREADILVTAIGKAKWVDERFVSEKTIVIDVGINVDENGMLCGDVNFGQIEDKVFMATPVPGRCRCRNDSSFSKACIGGGKRTPCFKQQRRKKWAFCRLIAVKCSGLAGNSQILSM